MDPPPPAVALTAQGLVNDLMLPLGGGGRGIVHTHLNTMSFFKYLLILCLSVEGVDFTRIDLTQFESITDSQGASTSGYSPQPTTPHLLGDFQDQTLPVLTISTSTSVSQPDTALEAVGASRGDRSESIQRFA